MGKLTISTGPCSIAIYVSLPEGTCAENGAFLWDLVGYDQNSDILGFC